jgi:putative endonuclease
LGASTSDKGGAAERVAADYLGRHGYRIIETNYRISVGEIDIVAEEGQTLCFVEVRSRRSDRYGHPIETINRAKQRRLARAAAHYLRRRRQEHRQVRFDVVGIVFSPRLDVTLVRGAFEPDFRW